MTKAAQPIPPGLENLIPHLVCSPCSEAIEFYKNAFGAEEVSRVPAPDGQRIMHAAIRLGKSTVFLVDDFPEYCSGKSETATSLGGTPVLTDEWQVDAVYSASQKCLSCTPGLSPVTFSDRVVDMVKKRGEKVHSWFMDINLLLGYWGEANRTYHHTAPTNALYALHESLLMLREEGLENAWARHERNHAALRAGLETLGLDYLVEERHRLPQMNAVGVLPGVDEKEVRRRLLQDYNLEIGAGLGDLAGKIWRFGIMGYSCKMENVMLCLCALETVFSDLGITIDFGAAEAAAYHAYAAIPNRVQSLRAVAA